jgi:hypothetical protein
MAALSIDSLTLAASGNSITWNAVGSSDTFANNGKVIVLALNGATGSCALTVAVTQAMTGASLSVPDLTVSIGTSVTIAIGPLPANTFNDATGSVTMTYANDSTLTVAVVKYS